MEGTFPVSTRLLLASPKVVGARIGPPSDPRAEMMGEGALMFLAGAAPPAFFAAVLGYGVGTAINEIVLGVTDPAELARRRNAFAIYEIPGNISVEAISTVGWSGSRDGMGVVTGRTTGPVGIRLDRQFAAYDEGGRRVVLPSGTRLVVPPRTSFTKQPAAAEAAAIAAAQAQDAAARTAAARAAAARIAEAEAEVATARAEAARQAELVRIAVAYAQAMAGVARTATAIAAAQAAAREAAKAQADSDAANRRVASAERRVASVYASTGAVSVPRSTLKVLAVVAGGLVALGGLALVGLWRNRKRRGV